MLRRLAWVTTAAARGEDADEPLALAALAAAGVAVDVVDWDDPAVRWASYDRAVLRSTWDYDQRLPEFLRWVDAVAGQTDLRNSVSTVRWNTDKHYLGDLEAAGLPVVPTTFVEPGQQPRLPSGGAVVKPAVGAGSRGVGVYGDGEHESAAAHVARLHAAGGSVLVQPLLRSVAAEGEWPLLFFDGHYSHAASKYVVLPPQGSTGQLFSRELTASHVPTGGQRAVAEAAVALVTERFGTPTYARVDLVQGDDDRPRVLEVELVEPSLFLAQGGQDAVQRLLAALVGGPTRSSRTPAAGR